MPYYDHGSTDRVLSSEHRRWARRFIRLYRGNRGNHRFVVVVDASPNVLGVMVEMAPSGVGRPSTSTQVGLVTEPCKVTRGKKEGGRGEVYPPFKHGKTGFFYGLRKDLLWDTWDSNPELIG